MSGGESAGEQATQNPDRGLASDRDGRMRVHAGAGRVERASAPLLPSCVVGAAAAAGEPGGASGQRATGVERESGTILERERVTVPVSGRIRRVVHPSLRDLRGSGGGAEENPVGQATRHPAQGPALHPQARLHGQSYRRSTPDSGQPSPAHLGEPSVVRAGPVRRRRLDTLRGGAVWVRYQR